MAERASAWDGAFGYAASRLERALSGETLSPRTELFRPLPPEPMAWLVKTFPTYLQNPSGDLVPLAPHHEEFWAWLWALRPGVRARTFISIWARGGGKSTSLELGSAVMAYFGLRRYVLYVCDTQKQANDHVATVATLLETLGVERAINRYGFSRGWSATRLRTAEGYTQDAIGMDAAARGVKIEEARPDGIFLDELDEQLDTMDTITKKIDVLTRKILPTGAASLAVCGVQNLPNEHGVFAQLADGRASFLLDRYVSGPHPAMADLPEQDWYRRETRHDGTSRLTFVGGRAVWAGQDRAACEALLNTIGPRAFEIECQHAIARLEGKLFKREWFAIVADWPQTAPKVRAWDFASTDEPRGPKRSGRDPDWTVGLLLAAWLGRFWVLDVQRVRLSAKGVEDLVRQTALVDGRGVAIWLEEEGGSSGKTVTADYRQRVLAGFEVHAWHSTGGKGERAKPVSSAAEAGNVLLVAGPWNQAFLEEVPRFGLAGIHDDQVDALALAHYALTLGQQMLPADFSLAPALGLGMTRRGVVARAQRAEVLPAHTAAVGVGDDPYLTRIMRLAGMDVDEVL
jgi:predicted phage terminase large subunit-like protein